VDVIVASDILLYAEQYDNLVDSLVQIFRYSHENKLAVGAVAPRNGTDAAAMSMSG